MHLEPILCSQCGAPLTVPPGVNYVTCNQCQASLAVRRESSATYTEVVEKLARQTEELSAHLADLRYEQQLERLDREWQIERDDLLVTGRRGGKYRPSFVAGAISILVGGGFGLFWTMMAFGMANAGPGGGMAAIFPIFGLVFIILAIGSGLSMIVKAQRYAQAEHRYRQRRAELEK
jgi:LSD1 subclass zinc finger protein